jgi:hypothetical protein
MDTSKMLADLIPEGTDLPEMKFAINAAEPTVVEVGAALFGAPLGDDSHDHVEPVVEIALYEAEVPIGEPVIKALHELVGFVEEVISMFAPFIEG